MTSKAPNFGLWPARVALTVPTAKSLAVKTSSSPISKLSTGR